MAENLGIMKIALINFTYNKKSGIENVADSTIRQIDRIDTENQYILFINESARDYYTSSEKIERKVVKMASKQIFKLFWLLFIYPLYSLIRGIDITIIFNCSSNFSLSPFTKNIIYIHDLGELNVANKYDIKRMVYRKFLSLPINKNLGDIFVVVSKFTQRDVIDKLRINKQKTRLIYNGTDENIRKSDKENARNVIIAKYGIKSSDKIIITIGRIDPVGKNLIKLVEAIDIAIKTDPDIHLFLIGESNFPNFHLVPETVEKYNLNNFITLTDYVDTDELNLFYNAADMMVFPSIYEGFGLPLLESMKCDLPVACSDIEVFHEVAGDAVLYFDPLNSTDMADIILRILNDNSLRDNLIAKGRIRYPDFTWEHAAKKLLEIIKYV